ncbi:MAG: FMN-binding negative transcriptional regulator [Novosphingobium sp.]
MNNAFTSYDPQDVQLLIAQYPLAWVQSCGDGREMQAALLPLVGEYGEDGRLIALIGHMARHNPLYETLRAKPDVDVLFTGPQAYVSPEHAGLRDWAPTWNYAQLRITADLTFDEALTVPALDLLIDDMERGRPAPWRKEELGARYAGMARAIIGFRAEVRSCTGIFKLGQDERPEVLAHILRTHPDARLVEWMRRFDR